ncbi:MAG: hypothetical protein A3I44_01040 [Candidatus Sungbacteria bacterium RIFCSPLOWO2_02_FULL_51_17]|uniref:Uncharacterized protein n=1 Tax=Candidatus Sungbacteria bacterium RIFCSPHIGHO2_02_FULL_51_29 TaxID=1802273 RepID=A0A1G2KWI3_9BACT|nr:MAG: hypothetical protein A2676_00440 [Candidatus Sungbacteria bacterium RIFCSPHIGHO2_01_FULL_51_22]OHA03807.1 MAG: hypothetical protein A3C16_05110 [Candidatus Sungbacteria bacterium RIFCSPHIGHO2_02_FULL_51_29]OHA07451.1 MAG: hypothetical protein A3B29_02195 [Candidatus Sungbacteria bacterium RIFCSPLOWO2_01_FULL_51_34]OHA10963.1 MAG: hypothetical protein A3I44_01040 [Candidatus Sungbacteria bacterium RIFCSPLOWO2_02_FULL_51_17]
MGFLFPSHQVTPEEYKKVRSELSQQGMSTRKLDELDKLYRGDMDSSSRASSDRGIQPQELEDSIKWLHENKSKHLFDSRDIDMIHETMKKRL